MAARISLEIPHSKAEVAYLAERLVNNRWTHHTPPNDKTEVKELHHSAINQLFPRLEPIDLYL